MLISTYLFVKCTCLQAKCILCIYYHFMFLFIYFFHKFNKFPTFYFGWLTVKQSEQCCSLYYFCVGHYFFQENWSKIEKTVQISCKNRKWFKILWTSVSCIQIHVSFSIFISVLVYLFIFCTLSNWTLLICWFLF